MNEVYVRPSIDPSDTVLVFRNPETNDKDAQAIAGIVVRVPPNAKGIDVLVGRFLREGMRHRSDPQLRERASLVTDAGGCWDYSPQMRRIQAMEARIANLENNVADLVQKAVKSLSRKGGE